MKIHPTAIVSPGSRIGENVEIGPYSIIENDVEIGAGSFIDAHVKVSAYTKIGSGCRIYYGALVGEEPQDHRFKKGTVSYTEIGSNTIIREYVTIHRPPFENRKTIIGGNVLLMAFVHVAHDVNIGDNVTIANHTALTGHVQIGTGAVLSGYVKIHQFCRIGSLSMVGACAVITQDVPPYCLLADNNYVYGPNVIGLRRAGIDPERRALIRKAIKTYFFSSLNSKNALKIIDENSAVPEITAFSDFIKTSTRGIMPGNPKYSSLHHRDDEDIQFTH